MRDRPGRRARFPESRPKDVCRRPSVSSTCSLLAQRLPTWREGEEGPGKVLGGLGGYGSDYHGADEKR